MTSAQESPLVTTIQQNLYAASAAINAARSNMQAASTEAKKGNIDGAIGATLLAINYMADARQLADAAITLNRLRHK